jgi:two-component system, chemotaxis family, sensor kinase CheA
MTTDESALVPDDLFAGLKDDREDALQYLSIFIDEAQTTLDELIEALLALETGGGRKQVEQLFVAAHRMKGSAASIGLNRIAKLSHLMEDLLQTLLDKGCTPTPEITDALLSCADGLRQSVNSLRSGELQNDHFPELAQELLAASASFQASEPGAGTAEAVPEPVNEEAPACEDEPSPPSAPTAVGITDELRRQIAATILDEHREDVLVGQIVFEPDFPLAGLKAQLLCSKLANIGEIHYLNPSLAAMETIEDIASVEFAIATDKSGDAVRSLLMIAGVADAKVEPLRPHRTQPQAQSPSPSQSQAPVAAAEARAAEVRAAEVRATEPAIKPAETLRVDIDRLDQLMNLAGQLAIGKARMMQISDRLKKAIAETDLVCARDGVGDLFEAIHLLDRVSDGIQQGVMNMRMLPIGPLFSRFHRVIRDITRANGKDISLEISGEGTELDKRMIDELGDPMIHIVRNCADHGIESPEAREAAGKPRQGTISLCAFHRGSSIVIRVSDDGRGMDTARILAKAVERGLVTPADAERMTPREIYQLVFVPGLSTAEKVTEVSGRGVGMDIVRSKIEELNGSIEIDSELGRGTTLTVKLPLTLAILPSLMVEIDGDVFAIPLESVIEIVSVGQSDIHSVQGRPMASVRDRVVPILVLNRVFTWRQAARRLLSDSSSATTLVVIGEGQQQLGLSVHNVLGEEDVVIKSMADNYRNVVGIAGASILGDGRVSLILDPHALIEMSSRSGIAAALTVEKPQ